jgi:hypothetical protein
MDNLGAGRGTSTVWKWTVAVVAALLVIAAVVALISID